MAGVIFSNRNPRMWAPVCILLALMFSRLPAFADTIIFQNQKAQQNGTVISEDGSSVTVRFPKTAIKSISRSPDNWQAPNTDKVILEEKDGFHILTIPDQLLRIRSAADLKNTTGIQHNAVQSSSAGTKKPTPWVQNKLMEEEMGKVRGTILWQGKPLHGTVKILLVKYTGFSFAALLKMFSSGTTTQSNGEKIILTTRTDKQGHYFFAKVPPGFYRLYWQQTGETDWTHRLREKPDFQVVAGNMTTQNIPAK